VFENLANYVIEWLGKSSGRRLYRIWSRSKSHEKES